MSVELVLARIAELDRGLVPQTTPATESVPPTRTQFSTMLASQTAGTAGAAAPPATAASLPATGGTTAGQRALQLAQGEVGQPEQPPGSNDSARIAQYRSATAGAAGPGPWCDYFNSWAARHAVAPVGEHGQGFGSVDALYAWAQRSGRAFTPSYGRQPQPG